jgi:thiamine pyrophosphate-dependent acetolactate synthase large subunit-like protein
VLDVGPRLAFPTAHPLAAASMPDLVRDADLVVLFDVEDPVGALRRALDGNRADVVHVGTSHLRLRSWSHDYQALAPAGLHITGDSVPALEGLVRQLTDDPADRALVGARELRVAGAVAANRAAALTMAQGRDDPAAVPVERLLAELRTALDGVDFVLGNSTTDRVEHDLWDLDRAGQWAGHTGGGGLGYGVAASIGVALAVPAGTVVVDVQGDGDLLYAPQALWTAARLALPLLVVVHDNRCYGNTAGHLRRVAADRGRPAGRGYAGNALDDPAVDLAGLARSLGVAAWGPISDAAALATAFKDAIETVRAGRPALVDVLTPGGPGTS